MLTIVTTETLFTINILYFFRKFNIQFKTLNSLIEEKLEGNYIFFDKDFIKQLFYMIFYRWILIPIFFYTISKPSQSEAT